MIKLLREIEKYEPCKEVWNKIKRCRTIKGVMKLDEILWGIEKGLSYKSLLCPENASGGRPSPRTIRRDLRVKPYAHHYLDHDDPFESGDEVRSQELPEWRPIGDYWVGKTFGEYVRGMTPPNSHHNFGKIEGRRLIGRS